MILQRLICLFAGHRWNKDGKPNYVSPSFIFQDWFCSRCFKRYQQIIRFPGILPEDDPR